MAKRKRLLSTTWFGKSDGSLTGWIAWLVFAAALLLSQLLRLNTLLSLALATLLGLGLN